MIRNEVKLIGRLTADPELKYTKETNKALCNVVLAVNSIYSNEAEYLHLVFWNKTAENLCKYKGKGDLIAVTPKLDPDHKKQEEYQMIHDALCADEDLPF